MKTFADSVSSRSISDPVKGLLDALEKSGLHDESKKLGNAIQSWKSSPKPKNDNDRSYGKRAQAAEDVEDHLQTLKKHGLSQDQINALSDSILTQAD